MKRQLNFVAEDVRRDSIADVSDRYTKLLNKLGEKMCGYARETNTVLMSWAMLSGLAIEGGLGT